MSASKQGKIRLQNSMIKLLAVADLITMVNAMLGFLAVLLVMSHQYHLAASLILLGLLADGLDGIVARRLGNGRVGEFLEPIADMISLSVAPLTLCYTIYYETIAAEPWMHGLVVVIIVFSLVCSIIRLSSFSVLKETEIFVGLPTSVSAMFLVAMSYIAPGIWFLLLGIIVLSLAMISSIRFPKLGLKENLITAVLIIATILLDQMYGSVVPYILLVALICYMIVGPLFLFLKKRSANRTGDRRS